MKKGQKVRIKSTGKIGVIADSEFFHWGGRKHVRYEVKFDNGQTKKLMATFAKLKKV